MLVSSSVSDTPWLKQNVRRKSALFSRSTLQLWCAKCIVCCVCCCRAFNQLNLKLLIVTLSNESAERAEQRAEIMETAHKIIEMKIVQRTVDVPARQIRSEGKYRDEDEAKIEAKNGSEKDATQTWNDESVDSSKVVLVIDEVARVEVGQTKEEGFG